MDNLIAKIKQQSKSEPITDIFKRAKIDPRLGIKWIEGRCKLTGTERERLSEILK